MDTSTSRSASPLEAPTVPSRRPRPPSLAPAPREIGPYELGERLGRGGMGAVYRARHRAGGPEVAVKVLSSRSHDHDGWVRFAREIQALKTLRHPSIVRLLAHGGGRARAGSGEGPWFAMELVEGPNLSERIARGGPMGPGEARATLTQLTAALATAHAAGLLHRDVKPSNVMLAPDGCPKLVDFGLVLFLDRSGERITLEDVILGTPGYVAPEGVASPRALDARSDLYQLAQVALFVRTGTRVFEPAEVLSREAHGAGVARGLQALRQTGGTPARVEAILARCLAYDPADRPASAGELLAALTGEDA